ncbi:hypothetical protein QEL93_003305 [Pseudomonas putida]|nr:hypothetical protein [Pseudomonas putida]
MSQTRSVMLNSGQHEVAALLRLPKGFDPNEMYPAVICSPTIRQQHRQPDAPGHDLLLSSAGFITLSLSQPDKPGDISEVMVNQEAVIRCATDYLRAFPFVDVARIGVIGRYAE